MDEWRGVVSEIVGRWVNEWRGVVAAIYDF